jgi:hypothetical protein
MVNTKRQLSSYESLVYASQGIVGFDNAAEYRVFLGYYAEIEFPNCKSIEDA